MSPALDQQCMAVGKERRDFECVFNRRVSIPIAVDENKAAKLLDMTLLEFRAGQKAGLLPHGILVAPNTRRIFLKQLDAVPNTNFVHKPGRGHPAKT